jgi:RNA polymerase sigma factor (sigma-70 family)
MRNKINTVLFHHYDDWSCYKAKEFKQFHKYKCMHIPLEELHMYARLGLMNAARKYKGKSLFSKYANIYIQGELYRGMTELHPLTSISVDKRKNKAKQIPTYFVGNREWVLNKAYRDIKYDTLHIKYDTLHIKYDTLHIKYDTLHKIQIDDFYNAIQPLDASTQRMIRYKFDYQWNQIRTNKQVAELMVCSEEHVRKTIRGLSLHGTGEHVHFST